MRTARLLTLAEAATAPQAGGRSRPAALVGGLALLTGSVCTGFGFFAAAIASAEDPKYTVVPQQARTHRADPAGGLLTAAPQGGHGAVDQLCEALRAAFAVHERGTALGDREKEVDVQLRRKR
jgi:hypothetical protein